jgi:hypothetical protein
MTTPVISASYPFVFLTHDYCFSNPAFGRRESRRNRWWKAIPGSVHSDTLTTIYAYLVIK